MGTGAETGVTGCRLLPDHRPSGFFVLRTPLLPVAAHLRLGEGIDSAVTAATSQDVAAPDLAAAIEHDRARARERLDDALADRALRAAIAVASPTTDAAIAAWRRAPTSRRGRKTERALMRYVTRAAGRPTPFGLFAGVAVGEVGARTALHLPAREQYVSSTRISLAWATELADRLATDPGLRESLTYRCNPSVYRLPGRRRYVARRREADIWIHAVRQLRDGPSLSLVLERARGGASQAQLVQALVAAGRASEERARRYVGDLIAHQLLVAELAPAVTGSDPGLELQARLEATPGAQRPAVALRGARDAVAHLDRAGLGAGSDEYRAVRARLRGLHTNALDSQPLTVELHKPAAGLAIGAPLVEELARGVEVLRRWSLPGGDRLAAFRRAFEERYGAREVVLTEALDEDAGIDPGIPAGRPEPPPSGAPRDRLLLEKLQFALRRGDREIVVGLDELEREPVVLPPSFVVGARVAASSSAAVDRGEFQVWLKSARGPDAIGMFARFCHADDMLREHVRAHVRAEAALDPDADHVEIADLPQLQFGPMLHRPRLREREIEYLGTAGAAPDRRLHLSDLLVSVVDDRVLLRSRRDGRWVVPRLSSALNVDLTLPPAFRLLVLVERQDGIDLGWSWGSLRHAPYLPRVRSGRTILAPAQWHLSRCDLEPLTGGSDGDRFRAVVALRRRLDLPRFVAVTDADNVLPVDLDTTVGIDVLLGLARGRETLTLLEVHPEPAQLCVEGPEGQFTNELVVPFVGQVVRRRAAPAQRATQQPDVRRSFVPGSEWLSLKLYCGASAHEALLRDRVGPLCERLVQAGAVTRWFFVRYADPDVHLRLRLCGDQAAIVGSAMPLIGELSEGLLDRRLIARATLDTYERELERYGGTAAIAHCEEWFHADSEAALGALQAGRRDGAATDWRWRVALVATDAALSAFGLDLDAKRDAMRSARRHRLQSLVAQTADGGRERTFAERYAKRHRAERAELQHALAQARDGRASGPYRAYAERAGRFEEVARALLAAHRDGALSRPPVDVCLSLVHMRVNRLLAVGSIEAEVRLYDALERLYASELARRGVSAARC